MGFEDDNNIDAMELEINDDIIEIEIDKNDLNIYKVNTFKRY